MPQTKGMKTPKTFRFGRFSPARKFGQRIVTAAFGMALSLTAASSALAWNDDIAQLSVLPGWQLDSGVRVAAVHITLPEGWKTYWRAPGDAGIPPVFMMYGASNLAMLTPQWPTPQVFHQNGMRSIGYEDELLLPLIIAPKQADRPITLKGKLMLGVCKDICVPAELKINARIDPGTGQNDPRIHAALANRPMTADEAGATGVSCRLAPGADGLALEARVTLPALGATEHAVIETGDPLVWVAEASLARQGRVVTIETQMIHVEDAPIAIDRSDLRITLLSGGRAVDIQGCPAG